MAGWPGVALAAALCAAWSGVEGAANPTLARKLIDIFDQYEVPEVCSSEADAGGGAGCAWPDPRYACDDEHEMCGKWARGGECRTNPQYMLLSCSQSCGSCFLRDVEHRCALDPSAKPAVSEAGQINGMFAEAESGARWRDLSPVVHSRDPWLITFENFMSSAEVDEYLDIPALPAQWERAVDAGRMRPDGTFEPIVSSGRTNDFFWCVGPCWERNITLKIAERIAAITRVPVENGEYPQLLQYQKNQHYTYHHDYIPGHLTLPIGPRLYTFFVYLSDVESGGETSFPYVESEITGKRGVRVKPRKGKAVLWPSVMDTEPTAKDSRTQHAALPVERGVKLAMNIWLHMYDFHTPFEIRCTG